MSDGEKVKLKGKGLYFVRCTPPGKPINLNGANDNEVLFGEISEHSVTSLDTIINRVYKPLVDRLDPADWGNCEGEQKKEFISVFDKFANELREALKSLQSNFTLRPYDREWEQEAKNAVVRLSTLTKSEQPRSASTIEPTEKKDELAEEAKDGEPGIQVQSC